MTQKEFLMLGALAFIFGSAVIYLYYIFTDEPEPEHRPGTPKPKTGEPEPEEQTEQKRRKLQPPPKKKKPPKMKHTRRLPRKGECPEIVYDEKTRDGKSDGLGL